LRGSECHVNQAARAYHNTKMPDRTGLVVGLIEEVEPVAGKRLNKCTVNIGADESITIVTNAMMIEAGKRVIVAPVGSIVGDTPIAKAQVGGVWLEGMLCDAPMVWGKGSANIPATVPDDCEPGAPPPDERPRGGPQGGAEAPAVPATAETKPLFEMKQKLSKEDKKAGAEAKKLDLAARKAARKAAEGGGAEEEDLATHAHDLSLDAE